MEAVVIGALLNIFVPKVWGVIKKPHKLREELEEGISSIKTELRNLSDLIQDPDWQCMSTSREVSKEIGRARELAQETEYCICRFVYQTRASLSKKSQTRLQSRDFANRIKCLKEKLKEIIPELRRLRSESTIIAKEPQDPQFGEQNPAVFGLGVPIQELVELLERTPPEGKLKVISIVGFGGSGKTRLANKVFKGTRKQFRLRAWIHMGLERNVNEVLDEILKKVSAGISTGVQQVNGDCASTGVQHVGNGAGASTSLQHNGKSAGSSCVGPSKKKRSHVPKRKVNNGARTSTSVQHVGNGAGASTGVQHAGNGASASTSVTERIKSCLAKKRYLVVIDDVRREADWVNLEKAFRDDDVDSRIIVTTTSQAVASRCSFRNGHVYKMRPLCSGDSDKLFLNTLNGTSSGSVGKEFSTAMKTCDDLPLAIIEAAESLKGKNVVHNGECKQAIRNLCVPEEGSNATLTRMQWVLMKKYSGLASHGARACLLYFHMFPVDNPIKRKSLIRRWLAEELVGKVPKCSDLEVASQHLKALVDGNIIRPMQVTSNATIKRRILPGTMYEFISHKSITENFVAFSDYQVKPVKPEHIRRLSLHGGPRQYSTCIEDVQLYLLRTLAVSGKACTDIMDFSQYKILRVLDLKEWVWDHNELTKVGVQEKLKAICKLGMLKYLGLPGSIGRVPREIEDLKDLETLDVGEDEIVEVYGEVIKHPKLIHLLGKFRLDASDSYKKWIPGKSRLETFSGFVTNKEAAFPKLINHMTMLNKVKMWCDSNAKVEELKDVSIAITEFICERIPDPADRSLSIDVTSCGAPFLDSVKADPGRLTKLKLHGWLKKWPEWITRLKDVRELCVSSTARSIEFLDSLEPDMLGSLKYLKLVDNELQDLAILKQHFPRLQRICLVGKKSIKNITFEGEALQDLVFLDVICEHLVGLAGIQIGDLKKLKEVALHSKVKPETIDEWKNAARRHPNRPQVLLIDAPSKP